MPSTPTSMMSNTTPPAKGESWEEEIKTIIDKFDFHIATGSLKSSLAVVDGVDELVDIYTPEDKLKAFLIIKIRSLHSQAYEEGRREAIEKLYSMDWYVCNSKGTKMVSSELFDAIKGKEKV